MTEITSSSSARVDEILDARDLSCPMPLLRAKQALHKMPVGAVLQVLATDQGSVRDFRAYVDLTAHELLQQWQEQGVYYHVVRKGEAGPRP
ncbi:sulfurtransferase TusA family protein [Gilvimarinus sp. DA14]|uniref:sulfurtransferase TusA family protein n=1 Tax=Gilvimarinus sp. DA14 TaxID=2956798 RepID=UPI0020B64C6A|nr:sulfurtransferase TusA family protein [Gilvimarinus sp. DA14]UTF60896.1 sulfurtransferase TusA family protein [Gilvimarinus sp. DA14]